MYLFFMVKKGKSGASKAILKGTHQLAPAKERGRPVGDESQKLTNKFLASFTETDYAELIKFQEEESVNEHSEATRKLVKMGLKLRKMLLRGTITYKDLRE